MTRAKLSSEAGFSLVEVMAALFIIGLTVTFLFTSFPDEEAPVLTARKALIRQVDIARNLSRTTGEAYGLNLETQGSTLMVFRRGEWLTADAVDREYLRVNLPAKVSLTPEGKRQSVSRSRIDQEEKKTSPQIWFDPTGIASGEVYLLVAGTEKYRLELQRNGEFDVTSER